MKRPNLYQSILSLITLTVVLITSGCGNLPSLPNTSNQPTASPPPAPAASEVPSPVSGVITSLLVEEGEISVPVPCVAQLGLATPQ